LVETVKNKNTDQPISNGEKRFGFFAEERAQTEIHIDVRENVNGENH